MQEQSYICMHLHGIKLISASGLDYIIAVQLLSYVWLFATPWAAACQAPLSFSISQSLLKFMPIELVMPSTISSSVATFFSCLLSFPASGYFPVSWLFTLGGQSIGASVSASVLPMNIQGWFLLGLTGLIMHEHSFKWIRHLSLKSEIMRFLEETSLWWKGRQKFIWGPSQI